MRLGFDLVAVSGRCRVLRAGDEDPLAENSEVLHGQHYVVRKCLIGVFIVSYRVVGELCFGLRAPGGSLRRASGGRTAEGARQAPPPPDRQTESKREVLLLSRPPRGARRCKEEEAVSEARRTDIAEPESRGHPRWPLDGLLRLLSIVHAFML